MNPRLSFVAAASIAALVALSLSSNASATPAPAPKSKTVIIAAPLNSNGFDIAFTGSGTKTYIGVVDFTIATTEELVLGSEVQKPYTNTVFFSDLSNLVLTTDPKTGSPVQIGPTAYLGGTYNSLSKEIGTETDYAPEILKPGNYSLTFTGYAPSTAALSYALSAQVSAAPEPAMWALMLAGFGGLGLMLRTARKNGFALASV